MPDHAHDDPLIVPGPGIRDAYSRRADSWPRHRALHRRRSREPPQRCAEPHCPFLTRHTLCPLHAKPFERTTR